MKAAPALPISSSMSRFVENAERILEAAESAASAGQSLSEMTILISRAGGISLVAGSGWSLDSLRRERGAEMAYRVSPAAGAVRVEGRDGSRTCLFEAAKPLRAAGLLPERAPLYEVIPATPAQRPEGISRLLREAWG